MASSYFCTVIYLDFRRMTSSQNREFFFIYLEDCRTHTYIHTYIHTYVHIYIHTYVHTYILTLGRFKKKTFFENYIYPLLKSCGQRKQKVWRHLFFKILIFDACSGPYYVSVIFQWGKTAHFGHLALQPNLYIQ